ncbi:MAG: bifunctional phosphoribosylaminoimidazolecarboxamide formyltransferase/IMP cyclohydrolase [Saprospiraceae bacterium]|nr:bifunctional phosphoribosylaminoimidazolecarboxamide formyltransferase/IMP cyclohydrolase [Saprospiraceae bacterium]
MSLIPISRALISVYSKEGLESLAKLLHHYGVEIYSTGGTQAYLENLGIPVITVESLTGYPSILDGRVKTLHPKVFGGILARREEGHLAELNEMDIPPFDLVVVDLYPFEETVASGAGEAEIIEKIDIGGISLIRAAAKNFNDVVVIPSKLSYKPLVEALEQNAGSTTLAERLSFARAAFGVTSQYDAAIYAYFHGDETFSESLRLTENNRVDLRYGENPHQKAVFYGDFDDMFEKLAGKELSFNNLTDIDAAVGLISEFEKDGPTMVILKHTNPCGVATRSTIKEAWLAALAADPVSAFGGIFISNVSIDMATAVEIDQLFYEVLIAPNFAEDALNFLSKKKNRILLKLKKPKIQNISVKSLLNGVIVQENDVVTEEREICKVATKLEPTENQWRDMMFAAKCCKHLKSNVIVLAKDNQLLSMGCGQTSRIDALEQAVVKANKYGFDLNGAVMASDAFFPFPDCVEVAERAGIKAVIQPGGSVKDQESIDFCDAHNMAMVITGIRHFRH